MRLGWTGRVVLGTALPLAAGIVAFLWFAQADVRHATREALEEELLRQTRIWARTLDAGDLDRPDLQERVTGLGRILGERFTLVAPDGTVLGDSESSPASMENHGRRPEILDAWARGSGFAERHSRTVDRDLLYAAVRLPGREAVARVALDATAVAERQASPTRSFWWIAAVVLAMASAGSLLLARRMARPLNVLTEAARRVEAGDLSTRVEPGRDPIVGMLGHAFNRMVTRVRESLGVAEEEAAQRGTILEGMSEGVVALDAAERISFFNSAARGILDVPEKTGVEGRRFVEVVRDPQILGLVQMADSRGEAVHAEVGHEGPPRRMIHIYAAPVGAGASSGVILVLRDLTQLRRLESMRTDFVSNVSHELRTPLASIAAAAETLADADARSDPEAGPHFVGVIRRNAARLEALLQDILALSKLESRPETLPRERVDFAALVATACDELAGRVERAELACERTLAGSAEVLGDPGMLRRIVDNLLVNAITYTPAGGNIEVRLAKSEHEVALEVRDTGIGIPPGDLERVFERFYRVDKARSRSAGGTGLGLAIVKHAIGLHGGSVAVQSVVGKGSRFTVRLPLAGNGNGEQA